MYFNFAEAIRQLTQGPQGDRIFRLANEARPAGDYLFNTFLPETNRNTFDANAGGMVIRATMSNLVSMDSPYPPVGSVEQSNFNQALPKIGHSAKLDEVVLRELTVMLQSVMARRGNVTQAQILEVLNFTDKLLVQPSLDTAEWMRGQALTTGKIDWIGNDKHLEVDYQIPAENIRAQRTGTAGYGGSASTFWTDIRWHRRQQKNGIVAFICHPETADMIVANPANNMVMTAENGNVRTFRRLNSNGIGFTEDRGDIVNLVVHGAEGEVYDLTNLPKTKRVPFCPRGVLVGIGRAGANTYRVGQGSTPPSPLAFGYTHLGPTVEGGGAPGRWARVFVPQDEPWSLHGQGAANLLPVVESPELVTISSTEMVDPE